MVGQKRTRIGINITNSSGFCLVIYFSTDDSDLAQGRHRSPENNIWRLCYKNRVEKRTEYE